MRHSVVVMVLAVSLLAGTLLSQTGPKLEVAIDPTAFSDAYPPIWTAGHLIVTKPAERSIDPENLLVFDIRGQLLFKKKLWFTDAKAVRILSATMAQNGNILVSAYAIKETGEKANLICILDKAGTIQTIIVSVRSQPS